MKSFKKCELCGLKAKHEFKTLSPQIENKERMQFVWSVCSVKCALLLLSRQVNGFNHILIEDSITRLEK